MKVLLILATFLTAASVFAADKVKIQEEKAQDKPAHAAESQNSSSAILLNQTLTPAAGQSEFTVNLNYFTSKGTVSGTAFEVKGFLDEMYNRTQLDNRDLISYYYGISNIFALGLSFTFNNGESEFSGFPKNTDNGIGSVKIGYKSNVDLGSLTLFSSIRYEAPLGTSESVFTFENTGLSGSSHNGVPHQSNLTATLGPSFDAGTFLFGTLFQYVHKFDGKYNNVGADGNRSPSEVQHYTVTNGNIISFSPIFEFKNSFHPNIQLNYGRIYTGNVDGTSPVDKAPTENEGYSWLTYAISTRYNLNSALEFNTKIWWTRYTRELKYSISQEDTGWSLGARMLF